MKPTTGSPGARARSGLAVSLVLLLLSLVALAPATAAFQDTGGGITGVTDPAIRVVNASPDAGAINVLVNGAPIAENVEPGAATEYAPVPPGDQQVQVVPASGGDPLIDQTASLAGETSYVLTFVGQGGEYQLLVNEVNLGATESGQARVRLVQAAADAGPIDIALAGEEEGLVGGVDYATASDYQQVTAGTYDLEARNADSGEVVATAQGLTLDEGMVYDIVALSGAEGQAISLLPLATQVSIPCSQIFGTGQDSDMCLRIVHASPDAGALDVFIGETPLAQGMAYGDTTEFVAAPSGQQQVRVVPAGGTFDQAIVDMTPEFGDGQAYQLTVTGLVDEGIEAPISGVDLRPIPENQARVRVVHASPDTEAIDVSTGEGQVPFDAIEFRSQSGYVAFDTGTYTFQLRLDADDTLLIELPDVNLEAGMLYDIYAIGESEAGTLQLVVLAAQGATLQGDVAAATPVATPEQQETAAEATPVIAAGATPVIATPGAATPAATPVETDDGN